MFPISRVVGLLFLAACLLHFRGAAGLPLAHAPSPSYYVPTLQAAVETLKSMAHRATKAMYWKAHMEHARPGEELDFLGVSSIKVRDVAKSTMVHATFTVDEALSVMDSPFTEERLLSIYLLGQLYKRAEEGTSLPAVRKYRSELVSKFIPRIATHLPSSYLLEESIPPMLGEYVASYAEDALLHDLAGRASPWDRAAAVWGTAVLVKRDRLALMEEIVEKLLNNKESGVRHAIGEVLKVAGFRNPNFLLGFLTKHAGAMPQTTLTRAAVVLPRETQAMLRQLDVQKFKERKAERAAAAANADVSSAS